MGAYSVSNDPREKIRLNELAKRRAALGGSQPIPFTGDDAGGVAPAPAAAAPRLTGDMSPEMQQSYGLESHRRAIADAMRTIQLGGAPKIGTPERAELANQIAFHRRFLDNANTNAPSPHTLTPLDTAGLHASQNDMDRQLLENQRQGDTPTTMSPEERAQRAGKMALYGAGRPDLARPGANPENAAEFQRFVGGQAGVPPSETEAQAVERVRRSQQMEEIKTRMAARNAGGNPMEDSAQLATVNAAREKENVRRSGEAKARQGTGELYRHIAGMEGQEAGVRMQIGRAEMQKKLAESRHEQMVAEASVDPETLKSEIAQRQAMARAQASVAKTGAIRAESGLAASQATAGGEQALAPTNDRRLDDAVKSYGAALESSTYFPSDEDNKKLHGATKAIRDYIASLPPEQAAAVKQHLLQTMRFPSLLEAGDVLSGPLGALKVGTKLMRQGAINELRSFLTN